MMISFIYEFCLSLENLVNASSFYYYINLCIRHQKILQIISVNSNLFIFSFLFKDIQSILLISLPIIAFIMNNVVGFCLSLFILLLVGSLTAIITNTMSALVTQVKGDNMTIYMVSSSFSGLFMNIL